MTSQDLLVICLPKMLGAFSSQPRRLRFRSSRSSPDSLARSLVRLIPRFCKVLSLSYAPRLPREAGRPLCDVHMHSLPLPPPGAWPSAQGCEKLTSPIWLLQLRARAIFLAVRWLESQTHSNETVVHIQSGGNSNLMPRLPVLYLLLSPVCCQACFLFLSFTGWLAPCWVAGWLLDGWLVRWR